ncbi:MarR family transcriptional regulator [Pantoea sp. GD03673]|uniref:MarR family winged helix-turn-helix transcriptional regulator n=1 Tax=Pantoea sp. GD03673 TaxID=2975364 RepID=UPI00244ABAE6|nr:MarR family transcriptional regulator [Pantoea sp. GD03673]MDH2067214.1 MarR family transcriptional regulator [Pantoea sp. GD03673]
MQTSTEKCPQESQPSVLLEKQLCFELYAASLAMTRLYQPHLKALGLTYPQYLVMLVLWEADGLTVKDISRRVQLDSGTLSHLLKRLEQSGFIVRSRNAAEDERKVMISLTSAGSALKNQASTVPHEVVSAIGLPYEKLSAMREDMAVLRKQLLAALSDKAG